MDDRIEIDPLVIEQNAIYLNDINSFPEVDNRLKENRAATCDFPDELQIGQMIGRGTFADVHVGTFRGTEVAIKICHFIPNNKSRIAANEQYAVFREKCKRESAILKSLNHENILHYLDVVERSQARAMCLIVEYINGDSMDKFTDIHITEKFRIACSCWSGLAYLHNKWISHKDIKPQNILISHDLQSVKIADFGLAELKELTTLYSTDTLEGTYMYLPPELAKKGEHKKYIRHHQKSDVYSLGATLCEFFSGQSFWTVDNQNQMLFILLEQLQAVQNHTKPVEPSCWKSVPIVIRNILAHAVAQDYKKRKTSEEMLDLFRKVTSMQEAELRILLGVKSWIKSAFVSVLQGRCQMWSAIFQNKSNPEAAEKTPMLLVHGFAGGLGLFAQNFDALCKNRTVYAFDLLGFGRSSRPQFSEDPILVELEWVQSIEDFRKEMKLDKMILVGHSFGGYLASAYALRYPNRVRHLVLVEPWGFPHKSEGPVALPAWMQVLARIASMINPLVGFRAAGPWGPDQPRRFGTTDDNTAKSDYIYHCNAQNPSGESALKSMTTGFGLARRPMIDRLPQLKEDVPITFIYGSQSWMDNSSAYQMQLDLRTESYVRVEIINGAGMNVYADQPEAFNSLIGEIGDIVDSNEDL